MKNNWIKLLSFVAAAAGALGLSACAEDASAVGNDDKNVAMTAGAAYAAATEYGYTGTLEEFVAEVRSSVQTEEIASVVVLNGLDSENKYVLITMTDGSSVSLPISPCNHVFAATSGLAPTCTSIGYSVLRCPVCGETKVETLPATGHRAQQYVINQSVHSFACSDCGEFVTEPHDFSDGVCTVCGYEADYSIGLTYEFDAQAQGYVVTGLGSCVNEENVVIPSTYRNYPVTAVGRRAFSTMAAQAVKSVYVPDGVTSIGEYAFYGSGLESVRLPDTLKEIGMWAFGRCPNLKSIEIPEGVAELPRYAFAMDNNLESVTLPHSLRVIGACAFVNCSFAEITVPDGVTEIQRFAFVNTGLTKITLPESVTALGEGVFYKCQSLASAELPAGLAEIPRRLFFYSALTEIVIPEGVTKIGDSAFNDCTSLTSVSVAASVTTVGDSAFDGCTALTEIVLPEGVTAVDSRAFANCASLVRVVLPQSLTSIGKYAFARCASLKEIALPDGVTETDYLFIGCTSLTAVTLPEGLTEIGAYTFAGCTALETFAIPESVTRIGDHAFHGCTSLRELVIPESVTDVAAYSLVGCTSLTDITYLGTKAQWKAVAKESGWRTEDNIITDLFVHCTDGDLEYIW